MGTNWWGAVLGEETIFLFSYILTPVNGREWNYEWKECFKR